MLFTGEGETLLSSVVVLLDASGPMPTSLGELEARFGVAVEVAEQVFGPEGSGRVARIPKKNLEIVVMPKRWEFNALGGVVDENVGNVIASAIHTLAGLVESPQWKAIGYNYGVLFAPPDEKIAVAAIAASVFDMQKMAKKLGRPVKGAATWLYLDIEERLVRLRFEPRAGKRDAKDVWARANFHEELQGVLPSESQIGDEFVRLYGVFFDLMKRM